MRPHRKERLSDLIIEKLGEMLLREMEMPNGALLTITDVEIMDDFSQAIVKFSVFPSNQSETALKILEKRRREFQRKLLRKINIKPMPQIVFQIDYGLEKAAKIEKKIIEENI
ncbi:MAG: 30S ribosome-binding factor RbfA [Candidatus Harrisonbacteria bacterium]|nr:30S ribosome-binding factor RbfA [Candidatus Harrisonbacteria bacterium]